MSAAELVELLGIGVLLLGLWLLVVGLFGEASGLSIGVAGVLLVLWGGAIVASANKHTLRARQVSDA